MYLTYRGIRAIPEEFMSKWIKVESQEDVELSEDGQMIEVYVDSDEFGNNYVEIPVGFVKQVLGTSRENLEK